MQKYVCFIGGEDSLDGFGEIYSSTKVQEYKGSLFKNHKDKVIACKANTLRYSNKEIGNLAKI